MLAASENVETNDEDLTAAEKKALIMMSLEEVCVCVCVFVCLFVCVCVCV